MRLYLDTCCLNRPLDDPSQGRVRREAEAVIDIFRGIEQGRWEWITSDALIAEVDQRPGVGRHQLVAAWLPLAAHHVQSGRIATRRAGALQGLGFHHFDALHVASAEIGAADVFLTTDDRLIRLAMRRAEDLRVPVSNPLGWLERLDG